MFFLRSRAIQLLHLLTYLLTYLLSVVAYTVRLTYERPQSASVAEWLRFLGQWKDEGSNPGLAFCLE